MRDVGAPLDRACFSGLGDAVGVEMQDYAGGVAALEAHRGQRAALVEFERKFLTGSDVAQRGSIVLRIQRTLQVVGAETFLMEDVRQRLARADGDHVPIRLGQSL